VGQHRHQDKPLAETTESPVDREDHWLILYSTLLTPLIRRVIMET